MSNVKVVFVGNDAILEVADLRNKATGANLNAATVTATLADLNGTELQGQSWPLTLAYVSNSKGVYRATLSYALQIAPRDRFNTTITVNAGGGLRARWVLECVAAEREE